MATIARRDGGEEGENGTARPGSGEKVENKDKNALGLTLGNQTLPTRRPPPGTERKGVVVVNVDAGSIADDADMRRNDLIEKVNRENVTSVDEFYRALSKLRKGDPVVLQVYRSQTPSRRFISLDKP